MKRRYIQFNAFPPVLQHKLFDERTAKKNAESINSSVSEDVRTPSTNTWQAPKPSRMQVRNSSRRLQYIAEKTKTQGRIQNPAEDY